MTTIDTICAADRFVGNEYQCEAIRQYGRDWTWHCEAPGGVIDDPEGAARDAVDELEREAIDPETGSSLAFDADARSRLVAALWESAERHNRDIAAEVSS